LIDADTVEDHIWQETYEEDLSEISKIFQIQSQIAQKVAHEIEVAILPEAQTRIQNIPTKSLDAYTFYLQARQHLVEYWKGAMNFLGTSLCSPDTIALDRAIVDFKKAIALDENFANSYSGLALAYWYRYSGDQQHNKVFLDSVELLVDRAPAINNNLEEVYFVRGLYERNVLTDYQKAAASFQKAISINPNYTFAFLELGNLYIWEFNEYINGLDLLHKIESLDRGYRLSFILNQIGHGYLGAGLTDVVKEYFRKSLRYKSDTILFYANMAFAEWSQGNIQKAIDWQLLSYAIDSTIKSTNIFLATRYSFLKDFENAYKYLMNINLNGQFPYLRVSNHRIGYILWYNGYKEEAGKYFQLQWRSVKVQLRKTHLKAFKNEPNMIWRHVTVLSKIMKNHLLSSRRWDREKYTMPG